MTRPRWKYGAPVLVWPNGDWPPAIGTIIGHVEDEERSYPIVRSMYGEWPCDPRIMSPAAPLLNAAASGANVPWGHC